MSMILKHTNNTWRLEAGDGRGNGRQGGWRRGDGNDGRRGMRWVDGRLGGCEVGRLIWILGYKDAERMGDWGRERGGMQGDYRLGDREGGWDIRRWGLGDCEAGREAVVQGRCGGGENGRLGGRLDAWEAGDWETGRLRGRARDWETESSAMWGQLEESSAMCSQSRIMARRMYSRVRPLVKTRGRLFCFANQQLISVRNVTPVG